MSACVEAAGKKIEPLLLAETADWWVIDKPAGWLTVPPSPTDPDPTPVVSHWARSLGMALTVHRLDVQTSGLLIMAKNPAAHARANTWFQDHQVKKLYHFLAGGAAPAQPTLRVSEPVGGKPATTLIEVRERWGHAFLGWARPLTGRRHQIRQHLAKLGKPILGDALYGGSSFAARVALHAARLELPTGEVFESLWPKDFQSWVSDFREGRA